MALRGGDPIHVGYGLASLLATDVSADDATWTLLRGLDASLVARERHFVERHHACSMKGMFRASCLVGAVLVGGVLAACSGGSEPTKSAPKAASNNNTGNGGSNNNSGSNGSDPGSQPPVDAPDVELQVMPFASYSGYDGTHSFKVPIAVYGAGTDLTLTASDPSAVNITKVKLTNPGNDQGTWFFAETKKAGSVTLTASSKGKTADTTLTVKSYDSSAYDAGKMRYMNGSDDGKDPACTKCHDAANGGIDHSPAAMASDQDPDVQAIITTGIVNEHPITAVVHKWSATSPELAGLVVYLRALEPNGFTPN